MSNGNVTTSESLIGPQGDRDQVSQDKMVRRGKEADGAPDNPVPMEPWQKGADGAAGADGVSVTSAVVTKEARSHAE